LKKINCDYTENVVCPHCGHVHACSDEWPDEDEEATCESCKKEFAYTRELLVRYCSRIPKEGDVRNCYVQYTVNGRIVRTEQLPSKDADIHAEILRNAGYEDVMVYQRHKIRIIYEDEEQND